MFQPLQPAHPAWVPRTGQVSTASSLARDSCPPSTSAYQVPAIITSSGTRCSLKSAWLHFTCDSLYEMSRLQWQLELWAWIETSSSQYPNLRPSFVWWSKPIQNTTVPRYFFNLKQNKIAAKKKNKLFSLLPKSASSSFSSVGWQSNYVCLESLLLCRVIFQHLTHTKTKVLGFMTFEISLQFDRNALQ